MAADRTFEVLEAINDGEALVERFENHYRCVELHRLRGVLADSVRLAQAAGVSSAVWLIVDRLSLRMKQNTTFAKSVQN